MKGKSKMKSTIQEFDGCFVFNFEAETAKESSMLARLALNSTTKIDFSETTFGSDGTIKNRTRIRRRKTRKDTINKDS